MHRPKLLKYWFFVAYILILNPLGKAAFTAKGGLNGLPYEYTPPAATGLERVFMFNGLQQAELRFSVDDPLNWSWFRYQTSLEDAQALPLSNISTVAGATVLNQPEAGGYYVSKGEQIKAFYVIDYTAHSLQYTSLQTVDDAEDICSSLQLVVEGQQEDLVYYAITGSPVHRTIDRIHSLSWNDLEWNEDKEQYDLVERNTAKEGYLSGFVVDAPLQDTKFHLQGDQFCAFFGLSAVSIERDYAAVHVCTHAKALPEEKQQADNEIGGGSSESLTGSAPFKLNFNSHVNPATRYTEWYIYTNPGSSEEYLRRTENDIDYTFTQAGSFEVKLIASNAICKDSAVFTVRVTESSLDCPNFFSPRSTPGDNDEFKVAYKSLIKFHGRILNRWGNVLFEWTDPSRGWDGTYKGKAVAPGVYFYIISATGSDGIEYRKKGDINLLE